MIEPAVLAETAAADRAVPMFEIPQWRAEFGIVAGVTGRGTSGEDFDLGLASDQPTRLVLDRWQRLQREFPAFSGVVVGRQVHGIELQWHDRTGGWSVFPGVDGHGTREPGILLTVSLADCVPIYLIDPAARAIALLHSGWRGTASGMLGAGLDLLAKRAGSRAADVVVHCGVAICGDCYQVGPEVAGACGRPSPTQGATHLDLRRLILEQAVRQGIGRCSVSPFCSAHMRDRFFSHRGSGGKDGRMVAFLGVEP